MARDGKAPGPARVVVTAGPTREWLDDVRFLTNASTGRMGIELARAALARGADVTLLLGPTPLAPPVGARTVRIETTRDLLRAAREAVRDADLVFFAAAPSDFRPAQRRRGKPRREGGGLTLDLVPTEDVARALGRRKGHRIHVGFALEVEEGSARAREKLAAKRFDAIVLNSPANFGRGGGRIAWIEGDAESVDLPSTSKRATARAIATRAWRLLGGAGR